MKITVVGTGYVGLVSGACLAEMGNDVLCLDLDPEKIRILKEGGIPIHEPGLDQVVARNVAAGRLHFTTDVQEAVQFGTIQFIAVGTPPDEDGSADLQYVLSAAKAIGRHMTDYKVIVDKSTVPVGTARQVERIIRETNPQADFDVASNPEFLREGAAISDFMRPDRVVIGVESEKAGQVLQEIYKPLYLRETPIVSTTIETAELTKYAANAFLAVKISFINEIAGVCEAVNANVVDLARAIGMDGRIGSKFLHPGPGYGGSCFPKDTLALMRLVQEHGENVRVVEAAVEANAAQKARMIRKIREMLGGSEAGKTIAVLGLTFKPETDDMRDAPAATILPALLEKGARLRAHDPKGMEEAKKCLPGGIEYVKNAYDAAENADCLVLMTEWNQYRALDLERLKSRMRAPVFIDLRNVYDPQRMQAAGFVYTGVGRK